MPIFRQRAKQLTIAYRECHVTYRHLDIGVAMVISRPLTTDLKHQAAITALLVCYHINDARKYANKLITKQK